MPTVAEIEKLAPTLTPAEALDLFSDELTSDNPRKGALAALRTAVLAGGGPAAPAPTTELAKIPTRKGVVVVIDADILESKWTPRSRAQKGYVVDILGDNAEYLAKRGAGRNFTVTPVAAIKRGAYAAPAGFRVTCQNQMQANVIADQTKKLVQQEGWDTTVLVESWGATWVQALDAAREGGGVGSTPILGVMLCEPFSEVTLSTDGDKIIVG